MEKKKNIRRIVNLNFIKEDDLEIYHKLQEIAELERRSATQQAMVIIEEFVHTYKF